MSTASVAAEQKVYYSVHVASFQDLKNANAFVNSLASIGKVVFWKETQVPDKGLFYRVYMGRFAVLEVAEAYWDRLKVEGKVSYRGIHRFEGPLMLPSKPMGLVPRTDIDDLEPATAPLPPVERPRKPGRSVTGPSTLEAPPVLSTEKPSVLPGLNRPAVPPTTPMAATAEQPPAPRAMASRGRFTDNGDGTVTDRENGLMWVKNGWRIDFFSALTWQEAMAECDRFGFAGYADWRLPTLSQWRSILDTAYECPALVEPNPFENVIVHMPYWSSSSVRKVPVKAYTVTLYYGTVTHQQKSDRAFIMPVRTLR
ncbi:MAG: DUF1566 domain-containing protein [Desulfobacterales bacterium]|nr:DUF1566 domain-containing protein [Desulfobacterales bacterium]